MSNLVIAILGFIILITLIILIVIKKEKESPENETYVMPRKDIWRELTNKVKELEKRITKLEPNNKEE
jgi:hypothetical protein